jgi:hypothetical protein
MNKKGDKRAKRPIESGKPNGRKRKKPKKIDNNLPNTLLY